MKYILIYKTINFITTIFEEMKFKTIEEVEQFINDKDITKNRIVYLGEYKPLKYKLNLGCD